MMVDCRLPLPTIFFAAVMVVSSWHGGLGPGSTTAFGVALACAYFFDAPIYLPGRVAGPAMGGWIQFKPWRL